MFNIPVKNNTKLKKIIDRVNKNIEIGTYWKCANITSVDRMGYSDHGPTHVKIVANISLRMLRILYKKKIKPSCVVNHKLTEKDAEVIVVLASVFHDIGLIVHREKHEEYSLFIAFQLLPKVLKGIYNEENPCKWSNIYIWEGNRRPKYVYRRNQDRLS